LQSDVPDRTRTSQQAGGETDLVVDVEGVGGTQGWPQGSLLLTDEEQDSLRRQAEAEGISMGNRMDPQLAATGDLPIGTAVGEGDLTGVTAPLPAPLPIGPSPVTPIARRLRPGKYWT